jgi:lipopolysaccharide/colanic/teichoic acid biosynthesis glycosyltransferase
MIGCKMRILDITFSLLLLLLLSPILLLIILCLRFTGEKKVFYRQVRFGLAAQEFNLLKFATMLENSPNIGSGDITLQNDPRVLPFGKFLRKTKLNEIPQLWNILVGNMSFVGYRPLTAKNYKYYSIGARKILSAHKPGLTGIGSIFFRSEDKYLKNADDAIIFYQSVIAPYKEKLELWYCERASFTNYLLLILLTAFVLFFDDDRALRLIYSDLPETPDQLR